MIFVRHAETRCVWDVTNGSTSLTYSIDHTSQILVVSTTCILGIELYIVNKATCILHCCDSTLDDFLTVAVEFVLDVRITRTDTGMNTLTLRILQGLNSHIDIFLDGTGQCTDCWPCHSLRDFDNRVVVAWTGYRESCLNDIDSQHLQLLGNLNLLYRVELATRYLFAITQCCVKNK